MIETVIGSDSTQEQHMHHGQIELFAIEPKRGLTSLDDLRQRGTQCLKSGVDPYGMPQVAIFELITKTGQRACEKSARTARPRKIWAVAER